MSPPPWQPACGSPQTGVHWRSEGSSGPCISPGCFCPRPRWGTSPAGCRWRSHPQPSPRPPTRGACPGADSERSVACHGMVFSMDFQETKKETKSKRINEGEGGGKEQNKAIEISSLASELVWPEPMSAGPAPRSLRPGI